MDDLVRRHQMTPNPTFFIFMQILKSDTVFMDFIRWGGTSRQADWRGIIFSLISEKCNS